MQSIEHKAGTLSFCSAWKFIFFDPVLVCLTCKAHFRSRLLYPENRSGRSQFLIHSHSLTNSHIQTTNMSIPLKISRYFLTTFLLDRPLLDQRGLHKLIFHSHGASCPRSTLPFRVEGGKKADPGKWITPFICLHNEIAWQNHNFAVLK